MIDSPVITRATMLAAVNPDALDESLPAVSAIAARLRTELTAYEIVQHELVRALPAEQDEIRRDLADRCHLIKGLWSAAHLAQGAETVAAETATAAEQARRERAGRLVAEALRSARNTAATETVGIEDARIAAPVGRALDHAAARLGDLRDDLLAADLIARVTP